MMMMYKTKTTKKEEKQKNYKKLILTAKRKLKMKTRYLMQFIPHPAMSVYSFYAVLFNCQKL